MAFFVSFSMKKDYILTNILTLDFADFCISGTSVKCNGKHHFISGRQEGGVIKYRQKSFHFIIVESFNQHLGLFLHLNFQSWIAVDVFLLDGKAEIGTQAFENVVSVGCSELLAEKVLDIVFDVKGIDFLNIRDASLRRSGNSEYCCNIP